MELFTALIAVFVFIIFVLIIAAVVRYAVDSSKTSRKLDLLMKEVRNLRAEVRGLQHTKGQDSQHIIDEKV
ncbi:hypothetical protein [Paenibacillus amylolyticus]|jgi:low affinity Fe/Cu permease|uniref:hypothetical protein n=1 Tax=Paenibacillus amylolyticus TaxID=1451 RepID=UPI003EBE4D4B